MRKYLPLLFLCACSTAHPSPPSEDLGSSRPSVEVYFSPKGGCADKVVSMIGSAKNHVRMQAYSFTSKPIIAALVSASKKPGITVRVVLDRSDEGTDGANALIAASIPVWFDKKHAIAHNKVIEIDDIEVEEGSFNYTDQAERSNAENCNFIHIKTIVAQYVTNWELHMSHSEPAAPTPTPAPSPAPLPTPIPTPIPSP